MLELCNWDRGFVLMCWVGDRSFDVGRCELGGRPLSWLSGAGLAAPWYYEPDDWGWFRAWGGGRFVTCGLDHTLVPGEDMADTSTSRTSARRSPMACMGASAACHTPGRLRRTMGRR